MVQEDRVPGLPSTSRVSCGQVGTKNRISIISVVRHDASFDLFVLEDRWTRGIFLPSPPSVALLRRRSQLPPAIPQATETANFHQTSKPPKDLIQR